MNNRRIRAFTLIELLVVIVILGILAALIVPRVIGHAEDARIAAAQSDIATLSSAVQLFHLHCSRFPSTEEGLEALMTPPADVATQWKGPYLDKDITADPWGMAYVYVCNDTSFTITSDGPDRTPNTADDISETHE